MINYSKYLYYSKSNKCLTEMFNAFAILYKVLKDVLISALSILPI